MSLSPEAAIRPYSAHFSRSAAEVMADLQLYCELLVKWQPVQNLVSRETLPDLWSRHIADSLQVLPLLEEQPSARFLDLGSGGGLPAIPLAIASKSSDVSFDLVEPNGRKVSFLRTVARELALPVTVHPARSDAVSLTEAPEIITARALAPLSDLCAMSVRFFGPGTRAVFHKGGECGQEVQHANAAWSFDLRVVPSQTREGSVLLDLRNLRPRT